MKLKLIIIALCDSAIGLVPVSGQGETIANLAAKKCKSCGGDGVRPCFSCKGTGRVLTGKAHVLFARAQVRKMQSVYRLRTTIVLPIDLVHQKSDPQHITSS